MNCVRRNLFLVLALSFLAHRPSFAQILPSPAPGPTAPATPNDPLGRQTPNGTLFGFLQSTQAADNRSAGDYRTAAQYLQMSPARREAQGEQIAK
jgi:hypothetical protein